MVVEKTDYLTGRNVRYLRVDTPDLPSSQQQSLEQGGGGAGAGGTAPAAAAGAGAGACTPPPRENGEGAFVSGGGGGVGSGGGRSGLGGKTSPGSSGWAPAPANLSPDRLFGDAVASASASAP